jgi:hypothetical protein
MTTTPKYNRQAVEAFFKANPDFNLINYPFFKKDAVDKLKWPEGESQQDVLNQLKGLQRLVRLTGNLNSAKALYEQGIHSALQIASIPQHKFISQYAHCFNVKEDTPKKIKGKNKNGHREKPKSLVKPEACAKKVHKQALATKSKTIHMYAAIQQHTSPYYMATKADNTSTLTTTSFKDLPSYQELFGTLDYCTCEDCRSIFSPAAYFVDLMRLQANYVDVSGADYYQLNSRRPDLEKIPLSCANTNTQISKLLIVNTVLENQYNALLKLGATDDTLDTVVSQNLTSQTYPFNLPFDLPLTQIRDYLAGNNTNLVNIWLSLNNSLDLSNKNIALATLGLSLEQWTLYSTPITDVTTLCNDYGLNPATSDALQTLVNVDTFLTQTGLSYDQLNELLNEDLSDNEIKSDTLIFISFINAGTATPITLDDSRTKLDNLIPQTNGQSDYSRLDHIHRFVRLAQAIGWSFTDLDWALRVIANEQPIPINDNALRYLAWMQALKTKKQLSINQCCALLYTIKDFGEASGATFFDTIYNGSNVLNPPPWQNPQTHQYDLIWNALPDAKNTTSQLDQQIQNALSAALQMNHDDLMTIAKNMVSCQSNPLTLTLSNLSIFYRISLLPGITGLSIDQCIVALELISSDPSQPIKSQLCTTQANETSTNLDLLIQFAASLKNSVFSLAQLQYILTGNSYNPTLQNQKLGTDSISNFLTHFQQAIASTLLTSDLLAAAAATAINNILPSTTDPDSSAVALWENLIGADCCDATGIIINTDMETIDEVVQSTFPSNSVNASDLQEDIAQLVQSTFIAYYQLQQKTLIHILAGLYGISEQLVPVLEVWGGLTFGDLTVAEAQTPINLTNSAAAIPLILALMVKNDLPTQEQILRLRNLQQYAYLMSTLALSPAEATSFLENPDYYGISYNPGDYTSGKLIFQFTYPNLQAMSHFKQLVQVFQDNQNYFLNYLSDTNIINQNPWTQLAAITNWDESQLQFLVSQSWQITPNFGTVQGLWQLYQWFQIAAVLNLNQQTLWQLNQLCFSSKDSNDYTNNQAIANALWGGLTKTYSAQPAVLDNLQSTINQAKRDTLVPIVIILLKNAYSLSLANARDLYEYLLIDVSVNGIVQTSYISEAISAVQLYIYRCLNNLEPNAAIQPDLMQWWSWIKNYRVWEANREVFLYPENYIEPELRTHATPLFTQLENDLRQGDLTQTATVETAFQNYMDGFSSVANLKIISSASMDQINGADDSTKTLCFIGCTSEQPYKYYYSVTTFMQGRNSGGLLGLDSRYLPVIWGPWLEISCHMKPIGRVTPVFAFGKWFIFWVEQQQSASTANTSTSTVNTEQTYSATIYYSYLNFQGKWVPPQALTDAIPTSDILSMDSNTQPYWDHVCPVFFRSSQTIFVPYSSNLVFSINTGTLANGVIAAFRYAWDTPADQADQVLNKNYDDANNNSFYYSYTGNFFASDCILLSNKSTNFSFSVWFSVMVYVQTTPLLSTALSKDSINPLIQVQANNVNQLILTFDSTTKTIDNIESWQWNNLILTCNANGSYDLYFNGSSIISNVTLTNPPYLILGRDGQGWTFNGCMQEVLFYNRGLTNREIAAIYNNGTYHGNNIGQMTQYIDRRISVTQGFNHPLNQIPIIGQPNWYIVEGDDAEFLVAPFDDIHSAYGSYLDCRRLNSTAYRTLSQLLLMEGIDGLLNVSAQQTTEIPLKDLQPNSDYIPAPSDPEYEAGVSYYPSDNIDFNGGLTSQYYWEIFFHAPFLIANALYTQQQFEAAKKWYEYIFNPTSQGIIFVNAVTNDQYWQFVGLRSENNPTLATELLAGWATEVVFDITNAAQLYEYHNDPFDPHAIAELRPIAYQKTILMHYINNLIAWGDNLLTQYTTETIVEATMLYVMAYDLLGKRPTNVGACDLPPDYSLEEILSKLGTLQTLPEFLIALESAQGVAAISTTQDNPNNYIANDYFGIPENTQFISYWDTVEQRLYDIRNSLNISGVYEQLSLYAPPINPMLLVQQVISGDQVDQSLPMLQSYPPYYRFEVMVEKAKEVTQIVIQLGQSLLAALEKQDAESLSLLYSTNRQNILALDQTAKQEAITAASQTITALNAGLQNAIDRCNYYTGLINIGLSSKEQQQINLDSAALIYQSVAQPIKSISVGGYLIPTIFGMSDGGFQPGEAISQGASIAEGLAQLNSMSSNLVSAQANYERRMQDWHLQLTIANDDKDQANAQIAAATAQQQIAQQELASLEKDLAQEQNVAQFLKSKFTSQQLYQWMVGKISAIYFQAYQLAYDFAIQAQQAWQFEKGVTQTFIQPNYWDNLHQGLITGEALQLDIQRMESAYMKQNQRRFEIEKIISLNQLGTDLLDNLKSTGSATFSLSEDYFNLDYPGHYCRQIKNITVSFPIVLGPYQNIHATLTQTSNKVLLTPDISTVNYLLTNKGSPNRSSLRTDLRANQQIALSQGLNDSGLFELNFSDPRYLPFEGTGAISSWVLSIPNANNPNVLNNLTDVVICLRYTALMGNTSFQQAVQSSMSSQNSSS